jgi:hypothetical protein
MRARLVNKALERTMPGERDRERRREDPDGHHHRAPHAGAQVADERSEDHERRRQDPR